MWLTRDEVVEKFRSQVALEAPELGAYEAEVLTQKLPAAPPVLQLFGRDLDKVWANPIRQREGFARPDQEDGKTLAARQILR